MEVRPLLVVAILGACGGSRPPPAAPPAPAPDRVAQFLAGEQAYRDRACACPDVACIATAQRDWEAEVLRDPPPPDVTPTPAQEARALALLGEVDACKAKFAPPEAEFAEAVTALGGFADRMCACADAACRTTVSNDLGAWERANRARFDRVAPTPAQEHVVAEAMGRMMTCASGAR